MGVPQADHAVRFAWTQRLALMKIVMASLMKSVRCVLKKARLVLVKRAVEWAKKYAVMDAIAIARHRFQSMKSVMGKMMTVMGKSMNKLSAIVTISVGQAQKVVSMVSGWGVMLLKIVIAQPKRE